MASRRTRYRFSNLVVDVPADWQAYVAELGRLFPAEGSGFETLFATIRAIHEGMYSPLVGTRRHPRARTTLETLLEFPRQHPLAVQWLDKPFGSTSSPSTSAIPRRAR